MYNNLWLKYSVEILSDILSAKTGVVKVVIIHVAWGFQAVQSKVFLELRVVHLSYLSDKFFVIWDDQTTAN